MLKKCLWILPLLFLVFSCADEGSAEKESAVEKNHFDSDRPFNPFVFRSVLDEKPRMLSLALNDKLWAAYDTETCALYKVWKGAVNLQGAVYNTQHGPQPISLGPSYFINKYDKPWMVNGEQATATFKGHRLADGQAILLYELKVGDKTVEVEEKPEVIENENGTVTFQRVFTNKSADKVELKTNVNSIVFKSSVETDGELKITKESEQKEGKVTSVVLEGVLGLKPSGSTTFDIKLLKQPIIPDANATEEEENEQPAGFKLIAKSDCKSCHNTIQKTVGPSYLSIARRYDNTEAMVNMLAAKVKSGGGGVWGKALMTAHPKEPIEDIKEMVRFIMDLDKEEEAKKVADEEAGVQAQTFEGKDLKFGEEIYPGVRFKMQDISKSTQGLDDINWNKKPKYEAILPNINIMDADFAFAGDWFAVEMEGYIQVESDDNYVFNLSSDDGSRMYLQGELLIDHDGFHGADAKDAEVYLKAGSHPFKIQYFQGTGGKSVALRWGSPSMEGFELIKPSFLGHHKEEQKLTGAKIAPLADGRKIPGDGSALEESHPSFDLSQARPNNFLPKVGGMDFLPDGRLVVSTWESAGSIYIVDNVASGDPSKMSAKVIAKGLAEPLGVRVVDGEIYVLQKQELTKLVDLDGDEFIDEYKVVCNTWEVSGNFHEFAFGLEYKDGYFYAALAIGIAPGGASAENQPSSRGKCVKIAKDGSSLEFVASGLRTPNGIGIGVDNEIFIADNQGDWLPASKIVHVQEGAFYGSRAVDFEGTANLKVTPPVVWLPQDEIGNSPSEMIPLNYGPYKNQMAHGEVTHGGLKRVFVEKVDGAYQGCVFRFIQGLEAGVNRTCLGPNDDIYVGGIGNPGNWGQTGKEWYGLQRLAYNEKPTFEMLAVRAKSNGMEIEFTEPIEAAAVLGNGSFKVEQWYYKPTAEYGGPKLGLKKLPVRNMTMSEDRKKVFLELSGMKEGHVVYIRILDALLSSNGNGLWTTEAWYTLNNIPSDKGGLSSYAAPKANTLTEAEKAEGWELLFDGKKADKWHTYQKDALGSAWKVKDGVLGLDISTKTPDNWQIPDGGDIVTNEVYENFEFRADWKISNCGNSGIMFLVEESDEFEYAWQTGPEMQVLDNSCHPDAVIAKHKAGDLYDIQACKYTTVKPAGEWNQVRIVLKDGKLEQWLNGYKIVETELWTEAWDKRLKETKWKDMASFAKFKKGKIALQDHGDAVWFRNLKIKKL